MVDTQPGGSQRGGRAAAPRRRQVSEPYDVLVAGAGTAGAATAHQLACAGLRVLWVDPRRSRSRCIGEALIGAARPLLRDLGLQHVLEEGGHLACPGNVSSWGSPEAVAVDFLRDPHGPAHHLDRSRFDAALRHEAAAAGARLRRDRVRQVQRSAGGFAVQLESGEVSCRLLVDATGRTSALARLLGARRRRDPELLALYSWVRGGDRAERRTWIEAVPEGWWYTALLPSGARSVVLHTDRDLARRLVSAPEQWDDLLRRTRFLSRWLDGGVRDGAVFATDAGGATLDLLAGDDWIAVGDAALSFEPLSSQGLFTALYTALRGAQALLLRLDGDALALREYRSRLDIVRQVYEENRIQAYLAETRFRSSPFWSARQRVEPPAAEHRSVR